MKAQRDQHFLIDPAAIERILGLIDVKDRVVLEIGPGEGALTKSLLDHGGIVRAIELDAELVSELELRFAEEIGSGRLRVIKGDAIKCELPPFEIVVSNLPYSASSKITFRLLETGFEEAVLMYQSEFARRMIAPVGTPDCGRLSVMVQTYACAIPCLELSPASFRPRPQVRSMVVRLIPHAPFFEIRDRRVYADVVRALFSHRRKTVRNGLRTSAGILQKDQVTHMLAMLPEEILDSRPEELYLEDFATIANLG